MYRGLAAKQESFQLHYQEACRLDSELCLVPSSLSLLTCPCLPSFLAVMLHQGGMPPDKIGQIRERKKLVEQILAKDSDEMKRTVEVSVHTWLFFFVA